MRVLQIPRFVDDPPPLLIFSFEQTVPIMVGLVTGVVMGQAFVFTMIGFGLSFIYARFLHSRPDGFMYHMLYWYGLFPVKGRLFPNPFKRLFIG